MRGSILVLLVAAAFGGFSAQVQSAPAATSKVTLVRVTSPVPAGAHATLTVKVSKPARCSITVYYKSGPSEAQGLYPKRTNAQLRVSWTWKVGTRTTPGRWRIEGELVRSSAAARTLSAECCG